MIVDRNRARDLLTRPGQEKMCDKEVVRENERRTNKEQFREIERETESDEKKKGRKGVVKHTSSNTHTHTFRHCIESEHPVFLSPHQQAKRHRNLSAHRQSQIIRAPRRRREGRL